MTGMEPQEPPQAQPQAPYMVEPGSGAEGRREPESAGVYRTFSQTVRESGRWQRFG